MAPPTPPCDTINIFDFFAGPGVDSEGEGGSPVLAIDVLAEYAEMAQDKGVSVNLYLNEQKPNKYESLQKVVAEKTAAGAYYAVNLSSEDFPVLFEALYDRMVGPRIANFLFLDQNGMKHITPPVFRRIVELKMTDFMFFISSSYIYRFLEAESVRERFGFTRDELRGMPYYDIHRKVCDYYRGLLPTTLGEYYLAPFSLKKGANIYGLIFGSGHILGMEKFLKKCWEHDPERGEADYDIDGDNIEADAYYLDLGDMFRPKKLSRFEDELSEAILDGGVRTNKDLFSYAISNGFLGKHARDVVRQLIADGKLPSQQLRVSYNAYKSESPVQEIVLTDD